jgi:hypothetical protein
MLAKSMVRPSHLLLVASLAFVTTSRTARAEDPPKSPPPKAAEDGWRQLRFTAGVSLTGVGVLTLITGAVLGVRAIVDKNAVGSHCNRLAQCDLNGYTIGSEAQDFALVSTAMFAVSLTSAAVGVGLLVSAVPKKPKTTAWVGLARRGVALGLSW